ncbi:MAG: STAS domain-containing protein [Pseudomonadota bacterium]
MKLTQETIGDDVLKITAQGSMDLDGAAEADPFFATAAIGHKKMIVDLSGVDFLASIGIRVLVKTAKAIGQAGGRMSVYGAQEAPHRVLMSTGVDKLVTLLDDEAAALAYVRS